MNFTQRVRLIQRRKDSLLCVGLDPDPAKIPRSLRGKNGVLEFCKGVVEATRDFACAFKINLAFFEALGKQGWDSLAAVAEFLPSDTIRIADGKRGDIGNSSAMYARTLFQELPFDAVTVNPYMGSDSVAPFLSDKTRGAFVLALTSNEGARDFQYLRTGRKPLYQQVVATVRRWNSGRNCGLVVGATRPQELRKIRAFAPDMPILIPGIGTQGGDLKASVRYGCTEKGDLAIINVGRTILYASSGTDFRQAARAVAREFRDTMNKHREIPPR
jgi:orotidine-5'-phosphate decarboxylase